MLFALDMVPFIWLGIMAVLLVIEIATLGLTTIWFAAGALGGFLVSVVGGPLWLQITAFIFISIVLLIFTRPAAERLLNNKVVKTNVDSLPGQKGLVTETIDNIQETGQVKINGLDWTARAKEPEEVIPKGSVVIVTEVAGVKVMVEKEN